MSVSSSLLYTGLFCCQTKERMKMEFLSTCFDRWHAVFLRYSSEDSWHVTVSWRIAEACQGELHLHPSIVLKKQRKDPTYVYSSGSMLCIISLELHGMIGLLSDCMRTQVRLSSLVELHGRVSPRCFRADMSLLPHTSELLMSPKQLNCLLL